MGMISKKLFEASEVKVGTYSQINEYMTIYDQGQGHSLTFVQGHSDFSNFFPQKTQWLFEAKFHMEPPWDVGMKICTNVSADMADDLETWYTELTLD